MTEDKPSYSVQHKGGDTLSAETEKKLEVLEQVAVWMIRKKEMGVRFRGMDVKKEYGTQCFGDMAYDLCCSLKEVGFLLWAWTRLTRLDADFDHKNGQVIEEYCAWRSRGALESLDDRPKATI